MSWYKNLYSFYYLKVEKQQKPVGGVFLATDKNLWNKRNKNFFQIGKGPSDFFDLFSVPGEERYVCQEIARWLDTHSSRWSSISLDLISENSIYSKLLPEELKEFGIPFTINSERSFSRIDTNQTLEDYHGNLGGKKRKELNYYLNRIHKDGFVINYREIENEISANFDSFLPWYDSRRASTHQCNAFESYPQFRPFLLNTINCFEKKKMARMSILELNRKPVAVSLNWFYNDIIYFYMPMFDERFKSFAPGKLLLYHIILKAITSREINEVNLMRGSSAYKDFFNPVKMNYKRINISNYKNLN
jgi:hypothetical protein